MYKKTLTLLIALASFALPIEPSCPFPSLSSHCNITTLYSGAFLALIGAATYTIYRKSKQTIYDAMDDAAFIVTAKSLILDLKIRTQDIQETELAETASNQEIFSLESRITSIIDQCQELIKSTQMRIKNNRDLNQKAVLHKISSSLFRLLQANFENISLLPNYNTNDYDNTNDHDASQHCNSFDFYKPNHHYHDWHTAPAIQPSPSAAPEITAQPSQTATPSGENNQSSQTAKPTTSPALADTTINTHDILLSSFA